jgi:hypothetical protein
MGRAGLDSGVLADGMYGKLRLLGSGAVDGRDGFRVGCDCGLDSCLDARVGVPGLGGGLLMSIVIARRDEPGGGIRASEWFYAGYNIGS